MQKDDTKNTYATATQNIIDMDPGAKGSLIPSSDIHLQEDTNKGNIYSVIYIYFFFFNQNMVLQLPGTGMILTSSAPKRLISNELKAKVLNYSYNLIKK